MAELSDLITELKEGNKRTQDQLGYMANDGKNSRRHLLEMKKEIFKLSENIAIIAEIQPAEPPDMPSEGERTEERRERQAFEMKKLQQLTIMAKGIMGLQEIMLKGGGGGSKDGGFAMGALGLGVGAMAKGIGVGLGAAGAGIGAFFLGLAGAEAIMERFGNGENIKKLLKNLGEGLDSLSDRSMTALAVALGAGAALGAIPGLSGGGAGMGIAFVGFGIGAFFAGLALADKGLEYANTDMGALKKATKGLSEAIGNLDETALKAVGGLLAGGAIGGALFGPTKMAGVAAGIGLVGLGIGAFFAGLATADAAANWMSTDGSKLATQAKYLAEGIAALAADPQVFQTVGGLLAGGAGAAALFGPSKVASAAVGMGAVGLGIGAFFAGLATGDKLGTMMGVDGSTMKKQMQNLAEGLNAFSGQSMVALGGLLGAGALFGTVGTPVAAGAAAIGMAAIGAGLAGFLLAFDGLAAVGDIIGLDGGNARNLMQNIAAGLEPIAKLDGPNLLAATKAIGLAGPALLLFMGSDGLGAITDKVISGLQSAWNWLTGKDEPGKKESRFQAIVDELQPLKDIDVDTLKGFSKVLEDLERLSNLGDFADGGRQIKHFATNLKDAMPDLETALYGTRQTGRKGYRGADIKGLANGGDDLTMAISNLNDLQAATGASLNEEPVQPVVNNYNFFDNSSPVQQQIINELKPKPNTNRLDGLE